MRWDVTGGCSHLKTQQRLETLFLRWLIHMAVNRRLQILTGFVSFSQPRSLHRAAELAGFLHSKWPKREQGRNYNAFYDLPSEVTIHHFRQILYRSKCSVLKGREKKKQQPPKTKNFCFFFCVLGIEPRASQIQALYYSTLFPVHPTLTPPFFNQQGLLEAGLNIAM